nr:uncharacterized protein LOC111508220 [Leptinotarsa decemlineata]
MRNPKYKIKERQINNYRELEYIIRKIIYANEPTLVEDVYHLCKSAEDRCRANFILIEHFILTRNLDEAMTVLDKNGRNEIYACTKTLVLSAEITINNKFCKQELKDNYYKALSMLFDRLLKSCQDGIERKKLEESFCKIRGVYKINKFFQRSLTTNDLMSSSRKLSILDDLIEEIAENVKEG